MVIKKLRQMKNQISISSTGWLQYIVERLAAKELDILMSCLVGWDQNRVKRMNDNLKWMLMLYLLYLWTDNCLLTCLLLKLYEARICQRCVYSCWKQSGGVYSLQMDFWRDIVIDLMSHEEGGTFKEGRVSRWIVWPPRFHNLWSSLTCVTHFRPDWRLGYRRLHIGEHSDRMPPNTHDPEMEKKTKTSGFDVMPTLKKTKT